MQKTQLYVPEWIGLKQETRIKLEEIFNIGKSVGTEVVNNTIVCDGHSNRDLEVMNVSTMQEYINSSEEDFMKLFTKVLNKVEGEKEEVEVVETPVEINTQTETINAKPKKGK